jgi:hypothetical protein
LENGAIGARLRARWFLILIAALIAAAVGLTGEYTINSHGVKSKRRPLGVGSAQLLVDSNPSTLATINSTNADAQGLTARAPLYAEYATGTRITEEIARRAGIPPDTLAVEAVTDQVLPGQPQAAPPPSDAPHVVTLTATAQSAVIRIATVSKQAAVAERLAAATSTVLTRSVAGLAAREHPHPTRNGGPVSRIVLKPLGAPTAGTVYQGGNLKKSVAYGVLAFLVLCLVVLLIDNLLVNRSRRRRQERAAREAAAAEQPTADAEATAQVSS